MTSLGSCLLANYEINYILTITCNNPRFIVCMDTEKAILSTNQYVEFLQLLRFRQIPAPQDNLSAPPRHEFAGE